MLLLFELKKIIKRLGVWGIFGLVAATAVISLCITFIFFNDKPAKDDYADAYTDLSAALQFDSWKANSVLQKGLRADFENKLDEFHSAYRVLNTETSKGLPADAEFTDAYNKFGDFAAAFGYIQSEYWLFHSGAFERVRTEIETLNGYYTNRNLLLLNAYWEEITLFSTMANMVPKELTDEQLTRLNELIVRLNDANDNSTAYINAAYTILHQTYAIALDENFDRNLAEYEGFSGYERNTAEADITLNEYLIEHELYDTTTRAFSFGDIYNGGTSVSLFDFIFNNLEIIGIPLAIIAIILMSCAFFTDIYTQTIIESVSARRRRITIVLTKIGAVWLALTLVILALVAVYTVAGILFSGAAAGADIVALLNNKTPFVMSQFNYFLLYLLSLLFKLSVFMLAAGLFSLSRARPVIIVALALAVTTAMILSNALLGGVIVYQFIPILALEPIKYLGAALFMSPMPSAFNIWFTFPIMLTFVIVGFFQLVYNFSKKDF